MTDGFHTLRLERLAEGVALATLDRPERLNAMTYAMFGDFAELAGRVAGDGGVRVLVLTGEGRGFCAGADLDLVDELPGLSASEFFARQQHAAESLAALRALPQPVIAAVNGPASGGGFSLALVADIRIAGPQARFNAAMVRIGLSAGDLGLSWLLPRVVGGGLAAEIMYTGRIVDAEEALRIGLVNRIAADPRAEAIALAGEIAANAPLAIALTKRALQAGLDVPFRAALELENRGQALATRSEEMALALRAFKDARRKR
jgi:enoyl-CoA hydratase/carnithine racemase